MTDVQQRAAAKEFAAYWKNRGDEKQETQRFWIDLLRNVYGVPNPEQSIEFEVPVKLSHTSFIDGYLTDTRVLIEQKGADIDLHGVVWSRKFSIRQNIEIYRHLWRYFVVRIPLDT